MRSPSSRTRRSGCAFPPTTRSRTTSPTADRLGPDDFLDPDNEKYMAFRGGCYADFLPAWLDTFGTERLHVLDFQQLVTDPAGTLRATASRPRSRPGDASRPTRSARRTAPPASRARRSSGVALAGNDRLERVLRRHPEAKRKLRAFYYRLNGRSHARSRSPTRCAPSSPPATRNRTSRLAAQLDDAGIDHRVWLAAGCTRSDQLRFRRGARRTRAIGGDRRRARRVGRPAPGPGTSATYTSAHSNTTAMSAGMAIPESLSA